MFGEDVLIGREINQCFCLKVAALNPNSETKNTFLVTTDKENNESLIIGDNFVNVQLKNVNIPPKEMTYLKII